MVAIDKASSSQLGLPTMPSLWPRDVHARLINKLSSNSAQVIAFDLRFDTPDAAAQHDETLANAIANAGNVLIVERLDLEEHRLPTDHTGHTYVGGLHGKDGNPLSCHRHRQRRRGPGDISSAESGQDQ